MKVETTKGLNSQFKHGDLIVDKCSENTRIMEVDRILFDKDNTLSYSGHFYSPLMRLFNKCSALLPEDYARLATDEEREEYYAAKSFAKRNRIPFVVEKGDLLENYLGLRERVQDKEAWVRKDFTSGDYQLIMTVDELKDEFRASEKLLVGEKTSWWSYDNK